MAWEVVFYNDAEGKSPVLDYLREVTPPQRRKIGWTIRLLQENATTLAEPHCKHLGGGLWELRTQVEGDAFRCLYVIWTEERLLILHVFQKKTPKTPTREIYLARRRWVDWLARATEPR